MIKKGKIKIKKTKNTQKIIKQISDYVLRTQVKQIMIKHKIDKIPASAQKELFQRDYEEIIKDFDDTVLEFNMLKYLYWNVEKPKKVSRK